MSGAFNQSVLAEISAGSSSSAVSSVDPPSTVISALLLTAQDLYQSRRCVPHRSFIHLPCSGQRSCRHHRRCHHHLRQIRCDAQIRCVVRCRCGCRRFCWIRVPVVITRDVEGKVRRKNNRSEKYSRDSPKSTRKIPLLLLYNPFTWTFASPVTVGSALTVDEGMYDLTTRSIKTKCSGIVAQLPSKRHAVTSSTVPDGVLHDLEITKLHEVQQGA